MKKKNEVLVHTVVTIEEDIIKDSFSTTESEDADEKFIMWAKQYGATDKDIESYIEDGYFKICNASVCMTSNYVKIS